jgi:hypothetical protein
MSTQKILTINPDAFKFPSKRKTLKEKKVKPFQDVNQASQANKLKKELLKKVKDYQKNKEVEKIVQGKILETQAPNLFTPNTLENSDFEREFNKSLTFLHDLSKKNKEKKRNRTIKVSNLDVHIDIPKENLVYTSNNEPSYGCLKNGSKPTFRDLVKTRKNTDNSKSERLRIALDKNQYYDYDAFHNKYTSAEPQISSEEPIQLEIVTIPSTPQKSDVENLSTDEKKDTNFMQSIPLKEHTKNNYAVLQSNKICSKITSTKYIGNALRMHSHLIFCSFRFLANNICSN